MTEEAQPLILSTGDLVTPPGRRFWLDDSMFKVEDSGMYYPRFSVQEVSKCFFAQGPDWVRWRMRPDKPSRKTHQSKHPNGFFTLGGQPMEFKRLKGKTDDPNEPTARYYTLADIERMAHALAENGVIDGLRLAHVVLMVRCCARLYGVVGGTDIFPTGPQDDVSPEPSPETPAAPTPLPKEPSSAPHKPPKKRSSKKKEPVAASA